MPVFEGLLPSTYDKVVQDLLFILACWYAYAKLCIHTDTTLAQFKTLTTALGQILCHFQNTVCAFYDTFKLPPEEAARGHQSASLAKKGKALGNAAGKRWKNFSMATYKLHSLGNYLMYARLFGPSDNYSTQLVHLSILSATSSYFLD